MLFQNTRRHFLRASGVSLALPFLESLHAAAKRPARLVCIGNCLGFHAPSFFPAKTGADFDTPHLLEPLAPYKKDLTVFSGLDHGVKGGHFAVHAFLSGVRSVDAKGMPDGNISIDQRAAETIGGVTRFPSLTIGSEDGIHGGCMMSWNRSGTRVRPIQRPKELFRKLFVDETTEDLTKVKDGLRLQGSILDSVNADAKSLQGKLGARDRQKLDEYFHSVRDVEKGIELREKWATVPKPKANTKEPEDRGLVNDIPVLYDLMALAIQTDSTRIATFEIAGGFEASVLGVRKDYHALSHHGQEPESIANLLKLERYQTEQFARFLEKMKSIDDVDGSLLKNTMILFGSGMGNGNSHTNLNLPIVVAGGPFRHGEHKAYPLTGAGKQPLCNLYVTLLQRFGLELDHFALGTSTLRDFA
ncbi:MAG: DUF1552 domain-containing protein [Acidobacteria bacterium]|nr:DUF1552 domain-containing protein [Acidobacteriota bacterium]